MCCNPKPDTNQIEKLHNLMNDVINENCGPLKQRLILLGGRGSHKCKIGNLIFNDITAFGDFEPSECVVQDREVMGTRVMIVNTPAVQTETIDNQFAPNHMKISESLLLTSPGPRVFVVVVHQDESRADISACFQVIENRFGYNAYSKMLLVVTLNSRQSSGDNDMDFIQNALPEKRKRLIRKIENQNRYVINYHDSTCGEGNDIREQILAKVKRIEITDNREQSLVLIGPQRIGKSHTGNNLLYLPKEGQDVIFNIARYPRAKSASIAVRHVSNHDLVVVDTPGLGDERSDEEVLREIKKCIFLPNGQLRPIAIVLRCDRKLREDEKRCLRLLKTELPHHFTQKSVIVFTRKEVLKDEQGYFEFLQNVRGETRTLLASCHWRCIGFENKANDEKKSLQNDTLYDMVKLLMDKDQVLRLVLIGHTGSGKSATGNTIVRQGRSCSDGRNIQGRIFNASLTMVSNTEECQVEEFELEGRKVQLVDTPGLFDTRSHLDNNKTMEELVKCLIYTVPGPHAFLFVINADERFTNEMKATMNIMKVTFGKAMLRHTVIVLTRLDQLKENKKTVKGVLRELEADKDGIGKEFLTGRESVPFDNRNPSGNEARELLDAVERMLISNEYKHFTNQVYEEVSAKLRWYGTGKAAVTRDLIKTHPKTTLVTVAAVAAPMLIASGVGIPLASLGAIGAALAAFGASKKAP